MLGKSQKPLGRDWEGPGAGLLLWSQGTLLPLHPSHRQAPELGGLGTPGPGATPGLSSLEADGTLPPASSPCARAAPTWEGGPAPPSTPNLPRSPPGGGFRQVDGTEPAPFCPGHWPHRPPRWAAPGPVPWAGWSWGGGGGGSQAGRGWQPWQYIIIIIIIIIIIVIIIYPVYRSVRNVCGSFSVCSFIVLFLVLSFKGGGGGGGGGSGGTPRWGRGGGTRWGGSTWHQREATQVVGGVDRATKHST